jgi:hypothetical protein
METQSQKKSSKKYTRFEGDTIERCPHDKENPYTMVRNSLIRDKRISPNCRMVIIFLLSNQNGWNIRVPQLVNEFKEHIGRDAMYNIITEAIEFGYMKRETYTENNMKRYRYFLSEEPKFKKCFRLTDFQDTGDQYTENQDSKERTSEEIISPKKEHIIIAQPNEPPKEPDKPKQPNGNNNFSIYSSLKNCDDFSDSQKRLLMKYPEQEVDRAVKLVYHPSTKTEGGPIGRLKYMQFILKNPESFAETIDNLDNPVAKMSKKEQLLSKFVKFQTYNGYEFVSDNVGVSLCSQGQYTAYTVRHDSRNFVNEFTEILNKCGIQI